MGNRKRTQKQPVHGGEGLEKVDREESSSQLQHSGLKPHRPTATVTVQISSIFACAALINLIRRVHLAHLAPIQARIHRRIFPPFSRICLMGLSRLHRSRLLLEIEVTRVKKEDIWVILHLRRSLLALFLRTSPTMMKMTTRQPEGTATARISTIITTRMAGANRLHNLALFSHSIFHVHRVCIFHILPSLYRP
jgi:hypothetical protein